jgi:hypothetical protein
MIWQCRCVEHQTAGNPTFQTPGIQTFAVNASISGADDRGRAASFPLWVGGGRRALASALPNDTLPDDLVGQYTPDQIRLMCVAEVRNVCWCPCHYLSCVCHLQFRTQQCVCVAVQLFCTNFDYAASLATMLLTRMRISCGR